MSIYFYSHTSEYGCFSNFSYHPVRLKKRIWKTSEHYFQASKFEGTSFETKIYECASPHEAARLGRNRSFSLRRKDWGSIKDNIMREVVLAKFMQNASCLDTLLSTGNEKLIEHTYNDCYWADGGNGSGKNMLGLILMEVRDIISDTDMIKKYVKKHKLTI